MDLLEVYGTYIKEATQVDQWVLAEDKDMTSGAPLALSWDGSKIYVRIQVAL